MPEHVCDLEALDEDAGTISVFKCGQLAPKAQKPSGKRRETMFSVNGAILTAVGKRTLRSWRDVAKIPGLVESP